MSESAREFADTIDPHPTLRSDAAFGSTATVTQGVLTVSWDQDPSNFTHHYFITDIDALPTFYNYCAGQRFNVFYWTPWSATLDQWTRMRPNAPIRQTITFSADNPNQFGSAPSNLGSSSRHPPQQEQQQQQEHHPQQPPPENPIDGPGEAPADDVPPDDDDNANQRPDGPDNEAPPGDDTRQQDPPAEHEQQQQQQYQHQRQRHGHGVNWDQQAPPQQRQQAPPQQQQRNQQQQPQNQQQQQQQNQQQQHQQQQQQRNQPPPQHQQQPPPFHPYHQGGYYPYYQPYQQQYYAAPPYQHQYVPPPPPPQHPAPAPAAPAPAPAAPAPASSSTITPPDMPIYDGKLENLPMYLTRIAVWKRNAYFAAVNGLGAVGWNHKTPATEEAANHIQSQMLTPGRIPEEALLQFTDDQKYIDDGILMLHDFLDHLQPKGPVDQMKAIKELVNLQMMPNEDGIGFGSRVRAIDTRLAGLSVADVLPYFMFQCIDHDRYPGIIARYRQGDTAVMNSTVKSLQAELMGEDKRASIWDQPRPPPSLPPDNFPSASGHRAQRQERTPRQPAPAPASPDEAVYPPPPVSWQDIGQLCDDATICPMCHYRNENTSHVKIKFHTEIGCPACAKKGYVCKQDPTEAASIYEQWQTYQSNVRAAVDARGGRGRGRGDGGRNRGDNGRGRDGGRGRGNEGRGPGARRVSPSAHQPPPPGPPQPPEQPPPAAPPAPANGNYYQDLDSSDDEDVAAFDSEFAADEGTDNSNTQSTVYISRVSNYISNSRYTLPFGGRSINPTTAKWKRRLANRRINREARQVRARRANMTFLSAQLSHVAAAAIQQGQDDIASVIKGEKECCGDTGATDDMLDDYAAFTSYRKLTGYFAYLGDSGKVPIEGIGTAVYSLNGKVIKTRHALHVPRLRGPLFSLRRHRRRTGCGVYSADSVGSYVLFPEFVLEVDDSHDNLLSYKSLGRPFRGAVDYEEPKGLLPSFLEEMPSGRPVTAGNQAPADAPHVIPDDATASDSDKPPPLKPSDDDSSCSSSSSGDSGTHLLPSTPAEQPPTVIEISNDELASNSAQPLSQRNLCNIHHDPASLPPVPPTATPAACESRTKFDSLSFHRIFGCRKFKHQRHLVVLGVLAIIALSQCVL